MGYTYHILQKVEVRDRVAGLTTAASLNCKVCNRWISGMGGGHDAICVSCEDWIVSGRLARLLREKGIKLRDVSKEL